MNRDKQPSLIAAAETGIGIALGEMGTRKLELSQDLLGLGQNMDDANEAATDWTDESVEGDNLVAARLVKGGEVEGEKVFLIEIGINKNTTVTTVENNTWDQNPETVVIKVARIRIQDGISGIRNPVVEVPVSQYSDEAEEDTVWVEVQYGDPRWEEIEYTVHDSIGNNL